MLWQEDAQERQGGWCPGQHTQARVPAVHSKFVPPRWVRGLCELWPVRTVACLWAAVIIGNIF